MHHTSTANSASTTRPQILDNESYRPTTGENTQPHFASPPSAPPFAPANPSKLHALLRKFSPRKTLPLATAAFTLLSLATYTTLQTQSETTSLSHAFRNLGGNCIKIEETTYKQYLNLGKSGKTENQEKFRELHPYACPFRELGGICFASESKRYYVCYQKKLERCVEGGEFKECNKIRENCPQGTDTLSCVRVIHSVFPSRRPPTVFGIHPGIWLSGSGKGKPIGCSTRLRGIGVGVCEDK